MTPQEAAALGRLRWSGAAWSLVMAALIAGVLAPWAPYGSLAVGIGVLCGIANMMGIMRGSERLLETHNRAFFGISSLLRLAAFSIVAAALAVRGPSWSLGPFLAGFFLPLATYALRAWRAFRTRPSDQ